MQVRHDGNAMFALKYYALAGGLHEGAFKMLCESMVKEAHAFDAKMQEAGVLL